MPKEINKNFNSYEINLQKWLYTDKEANKIQ